LEREDWQRHYADIEVASPAIHNVMRSFVAGRLDFIQTQLGQNEIEKSSFLDVGDSDGVFIRCLGKKGTSINTSAAAIKQIARRGGTGVQSDGTKLPFPDASYDYVLCFETLEHLPNPMSGLLELERVCRKGVIISVPHVRETTVYPAGYFPEFPQEMLHIFELSPRHWKSLLSHTKLGIQKAEVLPVIGRPRGFREMAAFGVQRLLFGRDIFHGTLKKFLLFHLAKRQSPENDRDAA